MEEFVQKYKEKKRERFLTDEEFHRLGPVLNEIEDDSSETLSAVTAIRLLMLTGCRLSEIQTLQWEDVNLEAADIRLRERKTGARMVPLSGAAVSVLSALPRPEGNPWVIVGRKPGAHLTDLQHPWRRIRARADLDDVRIHDLRPALRPGPWAREGLPMIGSCWVTPRYRPPRDTRSGERIRQGFGVARRGQHRRSHRAVGADIGLLREIGYPLRSRDVNMLGWRTRHPIPKAGRTTRAP